VVSVFGHGFVVAQRLAVPRPEGLGEELHLATFVVQVILANAAPTELSVQGGGDVAERGLAQVADGEWAGGVRGHELHLHGLPLPFIPSSVAGAVGENLTQDIVHNRGSEGEVDESACGLNSVERRSIREARGELSRNLRWRSAPCAREDECNPGR